MTCPMCKKSCQTIIVKSNVEASEHYCAHCHRSYELSENELRHVALASREQGS